VFLRQVLSADHSRRAAVARLIACRVARKERPCSAETGAYCQSRKRLPEELISQIARQTASCQGSEQGSVETTFLLQASEYVENKDRSAKSPA
jgi:hypothetical protein